MKFNHPHHQKILTILKALDSEILLQSGTCFGGGTLLTLEYKEYRWSKDIDLVCPAGPGYKLIRQAIYDKNYAALFKDTASIETPGQIKKDQYSIIFAVKVEDELIKFEIFNEARITLGKPVQPDWSPIPCLNIIDRYTEKLLANADRWSNTAVESRDLIDLCVLRKYEILPKEAIEKAEAAYPVVDPLKDAILNFQRNADYRRRCFSSLQITDPILIIDGLDLLAADFQLEKTKRKAPEAGPEDSIH